MRGEMNRGGAEGMSQKPEACRQQQPRPLTVSQIRTRVEEIAGQVASRIQKGRDIPLVRMGDLEAFHLDTKQFVALMSDHVNLN